MRLKYFGKRAREEVNKKNMTVDTYKEFYKRGSRHGVPDAIVISEKNILCQEDFDYRIGRFHTSRVRCPHCKREMNKYHLANHLTRSCKKKPIMIVKPHKMDHTSVQL